VNSLRFFKPISLLFICLLTLIIFLLQISLWLGPKNVFALRVLNHEIASKQQKISKLQKRNQALLHQINNLKAGHDMVEAKARKSLGMIKQGETLVLFREKSVQHNSS